MIPFPISMQLGMKRFHGHMFLAPTRLYFVCTAKGGAWAQAIGQGLGGLVGGAIAGAFQPGVGQANAAVDEGQLQAAVAQNEGSLIMEAHDIKEIKCTIWWRLIKWQDKKFGLPSGLSKDLKRELSLWTAANRVTQKGLS